MTAAANTVITPCPETTKTPPATTKTWQPEPVKQWFAPGQLDAIAAKQRLMSWEEMKAQINRSLGRPLDSE